MGSTVEISVIRLVTDSSLITKFVLLVLLSLSVVSWGIMLQKNRFLKKYLDHISKFLKSLTSTEGVQLEEACQTMSKGPARTMPILILKMSQLKGQGRSIKAPDAIINNAIMHDFNRLNENMNVLATAANVSPLIGLLGTVWGIIYAFINISQQASASIDTVAPGIAEALITTLGGLLVAIPAMFGHTMLTAMINQCQDILDRIAEISHSMFGERIGA